MSRRIDEGQRERGFTLIELLVVIVLLGILSGIAVFAVGNARDKATNEACRSQQAQLLKAFDLYYIDNRGRWPNLTNGNSPDNALNAQGLAQATNVATTATVSAWATAAVINALVPEYLKEIPPYGIAVSPTPAAAATEDFQLNAQIIRPPAGKPAYVRITSGLCGSMPK